LLGKQWGQEAVGTFWTDKAGVYARWIAQFAWPAERVAEVLQKSGIKHMTLVESRAGCQVLVCDRLNLLEKVAAMIVPNAADALEAHTLYRGQFHLIWSSEYDDIITESGRRRWYELSFVGSEL